jgi:putative MATE family efflux protein
MENNKMGVMPIPNLILTMSLPAILSMTIQALYNVVDAIFVSRVSEEALTALSLAFPIQMILIACFEGLGIGILSTVSRSLGEGNFETATNTAEHGYLLALILYSFVAICGYLFLDNFFIVFTDDPVVLKHSIDYTKIILIFSFGRILAHAGMSILQGSGEMIKPMIAQLIGAVANIILDPILIFGMFGLPAMGVKGAAIATITAQGLAMIYVFITIFSGKGYIKLNLKKFKYSSKIMYSIIMVGLPAGIMMGLLSIMLMGLNFIIGSISTTSVAVLGVYYKLQSFMFMPIFGISTGTMPVIGFNYGAKNKKRVVDALKFSGIIAISYMVLGMLVFQFIPGKLLDIFNSTPEMRGIGITAFRRISLMFPFASATIILNTAFQGMGKAYYSMIVTIVRMIIVLLPLAWFLGQQFGLDAIWFSFLTAELTGFIIASLFFRAEYTHSINTWSIEKEDIN